MELGQPTSYETAERGLDVFGSDGERVGALEHVLAEEALDVFDGIVIDVQLGPGGHHFADADQVDEFYDRGVVLKVASSEVAQLPKPEPAPAAMKDDGVGDSPESPGKAKLHRAWDLLSGNY